MKIKTLKSTLNVIIVCMLIAMCCITMIGCKGDDELKKSAIIDNVNYRLTSNIAEYDNYDYINGKYLIDYCLNVQIYIQNNNNYDSLFIWGGCKIISNNNAVTFKGGLFPNTTTYIATRSDYTEIANNSSFIIEYNPMIVSMNIDNAGNLDEAKNIAQKILGRTKFSVYYSNVLIAECYMNVK